MKKIIKMGLVTLVIFTLLPFCKNEEKVDTNEILGILLLKKNSESEGESLGLKIAFSTRFKKSSGEILSCHEWTAAFLDKKALWNQSGQIFVDRMKAIYGYDMAYDLIDGPCVVPNKVAACNYEGFMGINEPVPNVYSYDGERDYFVPIWRSYDGFADVKNGKDLCNQLGIYGHATQYKCFAPGQCWEN
ncbi:MULTISPECIES: LIC_11695 family lipoprotein [Leptospira]|nr:MULTISPECIES: LIC_11695 family lipoprotein [Leptospira]AMX58210.1 hypothetical protein LBK6_07590 [Leptospira borgpetersenii serovar Hardjo]AMX61462.1 hypothetical protein LBK9_07600 [Leptospira borgpetersenii serovar Hardjo]AMX64707.1 hypothetical protein LBK30_07670 [Leptospira borgpetersenii serovar Hardjo]AMX67917.1 hypothetical protein LBHA_07485 [Leptospira borgpetersenii serovar Hardjo]AMX71555.1 hypothetical protein LBHB_09860 [Leptospira borgpetersenii serovar Hardjo]